MQLKLRPRTCEQGGPRGSIKEAKFKKLKEIMQKARGDWKERPEVLCEG